MISEQKLANLHKLQYLEVLQIFHECVEVLGSPDMEEASHALGISKRRLLRQT
jgi:hypothetical protein